MDLSQRAFSVFNRPKIEEKPEIGYCGECSVFGLLKNGKHEFCPLDTIKYCVHCGIAQADYGRYCLYCLSAVSGIPADKLERINKSFN